MNAGPTLKLVFDARHAVLPSTFIMFGLGHPVTDRLRVRFKLFGQLSTGTLRAYKQADHSSSST
jgi:hypothetical protein